MKEYKYPLGVTSQFSFCGLPFRLDTYHGCSLNCTYCFARLRGGFQHNKKLRPASPKRIITKFQNSLKNENNTGIVSEYIRRRMPIHFGGMSDPFQPIEKELKVSLRVLEYLTKIKYPVIISTKSSLISHPEYLNLIAENPNVLIQFSFSTLNDKKSNIAEPFSTKPSELLRTIEEISKNNINTSIRWQPYIPFLSEDPISFIKSVSSTGIKHIGFEHLKLPVEKSNPLWKRMSENLGFNISKFYQEIGAKRDGRELTLPPKFKLEAITKVKLSLKNENITLGVADNDLQYLSDTDCCCSGADQFKGFENWNKYQISYAVKSSINKREIRIDTIKDQWKPNGSIDQHINSDSRLMKKKLMHNQIKDYIENRWQNINSPFNPTSFHNVAFKGKVDNRGYKIYEWEH